MMKMKKREAARQGWREAGGKIGPVSTNWNVGRKGRCLSPLGKLLGSADDEAKHRFKQQDSWWCMHQGTYHH
jgi:hypothetical protein